VGTLGLFETCGVIVASPSTASAPCLPLMGLTKLPALVVV